MDKALTTRKPPSTHELKRMTVLSLVASGHTLTEVGEILEMDRQHLTKILNRPSSLEAMTELNSEITAIFKSRLPALINKALDTLDERLTSFKTDQRLTAAKTILMLAMYCSGRN